MELLFMKKFFSNPVWNPCTRFLFYFVDIILVIGYLITWGDKYLHYLKRNQMHNGELEWSLAIFMVVYPICVGLLLALPDFVFKVKKHGTWRFDWIKFLAIGIPTFYCSTIAPAIFFAPVGTHPRLPWAELLPYPLSGFIFGFILLAAFYKSVPNNKNVPA